MVRLGQLINPWGAPVAGLQPSPSVPGVQQQQFLPPPSTVRVTVLRGDTMEPVSGARVLVYAVGAPQEWLAGEGETNAQGKYVFTYSGQQERHWRVAVGSGTSGLGFPSKDRIVAAGADMPVAFGICPSGTDALVCEVGDKQMFFTEQFTLQMQKWSGNREFAVRTAHAAMRDSGAVDGRLQPWSNYKSYGVADVGIPPADWPQLVKNELQMRRIFNDFPWPTFRRAPKIGDWFYRCHRGIPITEGRDGEPLAVLNFRLYSPSHSGYFPRDDNQIRRDLAARYILNMQGAFECIQRKLERKADEVSRSAKMMGGLSLATTLTFGAMLGPAGTGLYITETYGYLSAEYDVEVPSDVFGVLQYSGVFTGTEVGASGVLSGLLVVAIQSYLENMDMDPKAKAVVNEAIPQLVDLIIQEAVTETGAASSGTTSATSVTALESLGAAVLVFAVSMVANAIKAQGIRRLGEFQQTVLGFGHLEPEVIPFYLYLMRTLEMDKFFEAVGQEAGIPVEAGRDIVEPLVDAAEKDGIPVDSSVIDPQSTSEITPGTPAGKLVALGGLGLGAAALALGTDILG